MFEFFVFVYIYLFLFILIWALQRSSPFFMFVFVCILFSFAAFEGECKNGTKMWHQLVPTDDPLSFRHAKIPESLYLTLWGEAAMCQDGKEAESERVRVNALKNTGCASVTFVRKPLCLWSCCQYVTCRRFESSWRRHQHTGSHSNVKCGSWEWERQGKSGRKLEQLKTSARPGTGVSIHSLCVKLSHENGQSPRETADWNFGCRVKRLDESRQNRPGLSLSLDLYCSEADLAAAILYLEKWIFTNIFLHCSRTFRKPLGYMIVFLATAHEP